MPQEEICHITYNDKLKHRVHVEIFLLSSIKTCCNDGLRNLKSVYNFCNNSELT